MCAARNLLDRMDPFSDLNRTARHRMSWQVLSFEAVSSPTVRPYFKPRTIEDPVTAPQIPALDPIPPTTEVERGRARLAKNRNLRFTWRRLTACCSRRLTGYEVTVFRTIH
ncbi:MAG: hypothetical protein HY318_18645 [Armatimonadetes bacterium]|nr:hypothetical protein [Armatimonadota bacterium]